MSQTPSATIGKYQIIREIARSNDIVYEAFDPVMNRRVAVKELNMPRGAAAGQAADRLQRFHREARAAGSLVHPNIVTIYEVGEDDGRHFIAMEYLDGRNLRQEMDAYGKLDQKRAAKIAVEVLKGLSFSHEKGIIHRDIKPDNIQLLPGGEIKITDFGIARLTFEPNLTVDGQVFGTPSYMSPEQINGKDLDARSDLFGVGVILYEAISGEKPFQGDSVVSISYAVMNHRPNVPTEMTREMWSVVEMALEKTPQTRFANASAMINALEQANRPAPAAPVAPPPVVAPAPPPGMTPYGTPMPQGYSGAQVQQQGAQPYQPYNPGAPAPPPQQGQQQANPHSYQPYGQKTRPKLPIYYAPPKRRRPLISPTTASTLGRLFVAFLVIGLAIVLLMWLMGRLASSLDAPSARATPSTPSPSLDLEGIENPADRVPVAPGRLDADRVPLSESSDLITYESLWNQADALIEQGMQGDSEYRASLWRQADQLYERAYQMNGYSYERAARIYLDVAKHYDRRNDGVGVRAAAYRAEAFSVNRYPELERQAQDWIKHYGG